jgi:ribonuclease I
MNVWPTLNNGESDFDFWSREWNRHGKCGLDYFKTPFRYFKKALVLTTVMDITQKLADKNIYPDDQWRCSDPGSGGAKFYLIF